MRKLSFLALLTLIAVPLYAARGQSYITYDDGDTVIRQSDDGREVAARVNMPVYPGDEVTTSRRGRVEVRLSDGNVLGIDRSSQIRFKSILDSYEGDSAQTVVELRYGHLVLQRTGDGGDFVRLDTDYASYVANDEAIYAIDSDRGKDRVVVFDGSLEVRTPQRTSRVRAGEEARVDQQGLFGRVNQSYNTADDFERWFLNRAERNGRGSSRYLDRSLSYADSDLAANGSWTYVSGFGTWCWRPRVAAGWRPYYLGEWVGGPSGALVWVSYEPWGWVPYHYGRWAFDSFYGWVWLPGTGYSPAWVYWMYGSDYVGWAPAGWWDCYRPYYNWCYRPYARASWDVGWFGRMRTGDIDYRPWTFVRPHEIVGVRIDRAAVTTDLVRERLLRGGDGGFAAVSTQPARFTRNDLRDPSNAINNIIRRSGSGGGGTSTNDLTPFIRRDANLAPTVREHIIRSRGGDGGGVTSGGGGTSTGGLAPIGRGGVAPIGGGGLAPIGGGSVAPIGSGSVAPTSDGRVRRGDSGGGSTQPDSGTTDRGTFRGGNVRRGDSQSGGWRDSGTVRRDSSNERDSAARERVNRGGTAPTEPVTTSPAATNPPSNDWRTRAVRGGSGDTPRTTSPDTSRGDRDRAAADRDRSSIPRRIIESIGGPRVYPSDGSRGSRDSGSSRGSGGSHDSGSSRDSGGSRDSGSSSRGGERSSPPPQPSSPPPSHDNGNSGKSTGNEGRVHRDP
jgi:uncharacterized membrane protein YgcG